SGRNRAAVHPRAVRAVAVDDVQLAALSVNLAVETGDGFFGVAEHDVVLLVALLGQRPDRRDVLLDSIAAAAGAAGEHLETRLALAEQRSDPRRRGGQDGAQAAEAQVAIEIGA